MTWQDRIDRARARTYTYKPWFRKARTIPDPGFTQEEHKMSRDWGTCAVGEVLYVRGHSFVTHLSAGIETPKQLVPDDQALRALGRSFYDAVMGDQIDIAEQCYHNILAYAQRVAPLATPETFADQVIHEAVRAAS